MLDLTNDIEAMIRDRNMDEEKVLSLIKDILTSAYKRKFGTDENVVVRFTDDKRKVELFSVKEVVKEEDWYDEVRQIPLDEAQRYTDMDLEPGDSIELSIDPRNFEYSAVQSAKQRSQQVVKEYNNDKVYVDAKAMEGKLVFGEIKRQTRSGDFIVNLNLENTDAIFPLRGQSPRETYEPQDKLKFYVERVDRGDEVERRDRSGLIVKKQKGVRILLSRSSKEFVRALVENEVPEISNGDVEIKSIARQAGIRTKIAVDTRRTDIDPVGSTVGKSGSRIQTVMTECDNEKIDVVRYSDDPLVFVANALVPASIKRVVTIDPATKHVVAIVDENQQGIAIGQGGVNVKLAKMLCDWNIEVKTQEQFEQMEETQRIFENAEGLFKQDDVKEEAEEEHLTNDQIGIDENDTPITEVGLDDKLVKKLHNVDIWSIEEFFDYSDEELLSMGLSEEEIETVRNSVVIENSEEEGEFECPICHTILKAGTTVCTNCGAEFEFE
ncbi:MAG: transcription termination factor NusA [Candidatus Ornithospirochaeta sp.]|nr:transcription termination factor NusA [Candidatus Ornithospirochaeta sp.]